ncbi:unnamed protein product, partial [Closterium sp. Naga37s-1]
MARELREKRRRKEERRKQDEQIRKREGKDKEKETGEEEEVEKLRGRRELEEATVRAKEEELEVERRKQELDEELERQREELANQPRDEVPDLKLRNGSRGSGATGARLTDPLGLVRDESGVEGQGGGREARWGGEGRGGRMGNSSLNLLASRGMARKDFRKEWAKGRLRDGRARELAGEGARMWMGRARRQRRGELGRRGGAVGGKGNWPAEGWAGGGLGREGREGIGNGVGNRSAAAGGFSQAGSESRRAEAEAVWKERQKQVVAAFRHAWKGYRTYAFGLDELMPLSRGGEDGLGRLGATIVDGLDTAMIMGIKDIVDDAGQWVVTTLPEKINHAGQSPTPVPLSDVYLAGRYAQRANGGGLSSTAECTTVQLEFWELSRLTGERKYGAAAMQVMEHVRGLHRLDGLVPIYMDPDSGRFSGENIRLGSRGDSYYEYLIKAYLQQRDHPPALLQVVTTSFTASGDGRSNGTDAAAAGAGAGGGAGGGDTSRGGSVVEARAGGSGGGAGGGEKGEGRRGAHVEYLAEMFDEAVAGMRKWLVARSHPKGLTFIAERPSGLLGELHPKMDHLVCFLPGSLALRATEGLTEAEAAARGVLTQQGRELLDLARNVTEACIQMYQVTATGLAPEIAYFNMREDSQEYMGTRHDAEYGRDIQIHQADRHNLLRPETVEALLYMHRVTGNTR